MSNDDEYIYVKLWKGFLLKDAEGEPEHKLAHLLAIGDVFCNNGWWDKDWPKDKVTLHVNCNDIFAWGCADSEDLDYSEVDELYEMFKKSENHGAAAWCIKKRKLRPQAPVEKMFKESLPWDLEELIKGNLVEKDI